MALESVGRSSHDNLITDSMFRLSAICLLLETHFLISVNRHREFSPLTARIVGLRGIYFSAACTSFLNRCFKEELVYYHFSSVVIRRYCNSRHCTLHLCTISIACVLVQPQTTPAKKVLRATVADLLHDGTEAMTAHTYFSTTYPTRYL